MPFAKFFSATKTNPGQLITDDIYNGNANFYLDGINLLDCVTPPVLELARKDRSVSLTWTGSYKAFSA